MKTIGIAIEGVLMDHLDQFDQVYKKAFIFNPSIMESGAKRNEDGTINMKEESKEDVVNKQNEIKAKIDQLITKPIESPDLTNHYSFENMIEDPFWAPIGQDVFDENSNDPDFMLKPMDSYEKTETNYLDAQEAYDYFRFEERPMELYAQAQAVQGSIMALHKLQQKGQQSGLFNVVLLSTLRGKAITATYSFLGLNGVRARSVEFVAEDYDKWDKCDILIDVMPEAIQSVEPGKEIIKINTPFNKWDEVEHSCASLHALTKDKKLFNFIEEFCKLEEEKVSEK